MEGDRGCRCCWIWSLRLFLLFLVLGPNAAPGQSLSILKQDHSQCSIRATTPRAARYVLQASQNLNLWLDLNDSISGTVTNRVGGAGVPQCAFRLTPWVADAAPITVMLLGDSTVADFASDGNYF